MRLDFFVVFAHGVDKIDGILEILSKYEDLELIYFKRYTPKDNIDFIRELYSTDAVPWQHIKAKTDYLHRIGFADTYIGLLKNNRPEEKIVGEGEYRHIQCMLINRFKWEVREKYNPIIDGERSEHHVIHTSDFESQTYEFWNTLPFQSIDSIIGSSCPTIEAPFYLERFVDYTIERTSIEDLLVSEISDDELRQVPIKESIYYKYVMGDKKPYIDYWDKHKGVNLVLNGSPVMFDKLIDRFDKKKIGNIFVKGGIVQDGNHRLAIMLNKGIKKWMIIKIK